MATENSDTPEQAERVELAKVPCVLCGRSLALGDYLVIFFANFWVHNQCWMHRQREG